MDPLLAVLFVVAFVLMAGVATWHMFSGEIVGSVDAVHVSIFGQRRGARLTVRRAGDPRAPTAHLQARVAMGYRGVSLSTANAVRCADLLERCAAEGRVTEGAAGVRVSGVEIAPDFDLEEGRAVAMVFPGGGDDINMRILVTPRQASLAAGWLRIAIAPGETLQQARSNARIAAERKRAARSGPS